MCNSSGYEKRYEWAGSWHSADEAFSILSAHFFSGWPLAAAKIVDEI